MGKLSVAESIGDDPNFVVLPLQKVATDSLGS